MLRFEDQEVAAGAHGIFEQMLKHSRRIDPGWFKTQSWWQRWQYRWAHFLVARIDPLVALRQFGAVK